MAAVEANVATTETDDSFYVRAHLTISDCNRRATLEFDAYTYEDNLKGDMKQLKERQHKLAILKERMLKFFTALEAAYQEMEEKLPEKVEAAARKKAEKKVKKRVRDILP